MSISKRINWTKIVLPLLTVLLVSSFSLSEKTQEWGLFRLTQSKAYQIGYQDTVTYRFIDTQWEYHSPTQLYKSVPLVGDGEGTYTCYQICFSGEYYNQVPLEYAFDIYDSTGNVRLYSSIYYDSGTPVNVGLPLVQSTTDIVYRCHIYVQKKGGNSQINRTDMYASNLTWYVNRTTEVEQNTLPADWLDTTTASTPQYTTYTTVATNVDYEGVLTTLTVPSDVRSAVAQFEQIIYQIWNLHYIPFIIIFAIIIGLCGWLLH